MRRGLCRCNNLVQVTIDPAKRAKTLAERGLDFADAALVFEGDGQSSLGSFLHQPVLSNGPMAFANRNHLAAAAATCHRGDMGSLQRQPHPSGQVSRPGTSSSRTRRRSKKVASTANAAAYPRKPVEICIVGLRVFSKPARCAMPGPLEKRRQPSGYSPGRQSACHRKTWCPQ